MSRSIAALSSSLAVALLCTCCGITANAQPAAPANQANATQANATQANATQANATNVQVRYADARLRLARVDLETSLEMNRMTRGAVSERELRRLKTNIEVAQQQLEIAKEYTHGSTKPTQLAAAEAAAKLADRDVRAALDVNKKNPGMIPGMMVKRLKIKAELATIRVELWKDPAYLPSLVDEMQWQIDRLTEQVIDLSQKINSPRPRP